MTTALLCAGCFVLGCLLGLLAGAYRWRGSGRHRGHPTMRG